MRSTRPTPSRALLLWVNTPGNPAGGLDDLAAVARWGRERGVPVFSDECYAEFTWDGPPQTVLGHGGGPDGLDGVVAVHSLSKRSNLAGMRVGWYSGDPELVDYLREVRKHAGFMVPGPVQQARGRRPRRTPPTSSQQRERYWERLSPGPGDPGRPSGSTVTFRAVGSTCGRRRPEGTAGPGPGGWPSAEAAGVAGIVLRTPG